MAAGSTYLSPGRRSFPRPPPSRGPSQQTHCNGGVRLSDSWLCCAASGPRYQPQANPSFPRPPAPSTGEPRRTTASATGTSTNSARSPGPAAGPQPLSHRRASALTGSGAGARGRAVAGAGIEPGAVATARNLYGSRAQIGLELLRILLAAPDVSGSASSVPTAAAAAAAAATSVPERTEAASAAEADADAEMGTVAAAACLQSVASLVEEVSGLMAVHRDMAGLQQAMARCAAEANAAHSRGGDDGWGGTAGGGGRGAGGAGMGRFRTGFTAGSLSGRRAFGSRYGSSGTGTASRAARPAGGGVAKGTDFSGSTAVHPPTSSPAAPSPASPSPSCNDGSGSSHVGAVGLTGSPPAMATAQPQPTQLPSATDGSTGQPLPPAPGHDAPWDWAGVKRLVVIGLGSLGSYQEALRSGRQTERESTRAAARLYQLALSRLLGSPAVLPGLGLGWTAAGAGPTPAAAAEPTTRIAAATAAISKEADTAAAAGPATAAAAAPVVSYYDPEYLPWDLQLIHGLWGADAVPAGSGATSEGSGCEDGCQQPQQLSPPPQAPAAAAAAVAATAPPPRAAFIANAAAPPPEAQRTSAGGPGPLPATAAATMAPAAALLAHTPTLFYAPCCPREVYDEIVRRNLAAGTLGNVALVGNSLRGQADAAALLAAFGGAALMGGDLASGRPAGRGLGLGLGRGGVDAAVGGTAGGSDGEAVGKEEFVGLVTSGRVVEVLLPDFAAHGVATSLHLFV